jgi:hypothetical protein
LPRRLPKELGVLERLSGDDDVRAFGRYFPPVIWIGQDNVDVVAGGKIDSHIFPGREREKGAIGSINVLAAQIENDERFPAACFEISASKSRHLIERALVHRAAVNDACRSFATALSKSALHSRREIQS